MGLMSLPTKEKYEELKEKRKEEQEKKLQQERQVRSCMTADFVLFKVKASYFDLIRHEFLHALHISTNTLILY